MQPLMDNVLGAWVCCLCRNHRNRYDDAEAVRHLRTLHPREWLKALKEPPPGYWMELAARLDKMGSSMYRN